MRYSFTKAALVAGLLVSTPAWGQSRVDELAAAAAVQGTDTIPLCQGCGAAVDLVEATITQILTYINANAVIPLATGISGLGANIATFLATPSSANFAAAVTGETGTGALVFGTSPTIASPALTGTPTVPTASVGTDTTQAASTAFVLANAGAGSSGAGVAGGQARDTVAGTADSSIATGKYYVSLSSNTNANRTYTLPAASSVTSGGLLVFTDEGGNITGGFTVTLQRAGSDTIDGGTTTSALGVQYGGWVLESNGTDKWHVVSANTIGPQAASSNNFLTGLGDDGVFTRAQPAFSNLSGAAAQTQIAAATLGTGTSVTLTAPRQYYVCTGTCTVTPPVPAAGYEFCVMNDNNVATVITLAALGASAMYENTARTAYGTAGTGTFVSGGAAGDKVCLVGRDSTHYLTASYSGTWTAN